MRRELGVGTSVRNVGHKDRCFARKNHEINVISYTGSRFIETTKTVGEATVTRCEVQNCVSMMIGSPSLRVSHAKRVIARDPISWTFREEFRRENHVVQLDEDAETHKAPQRRLRLYENGAYLRGKPGGVNHIDQYDHLPLSLVMETGLSARRGHEGRSADSQR